MCRLYTGIGADTQFSRDFLAAQEKFCRLDCQRLLRAAQLSRLSYKTRAHARSYISDPVRHGTSSNLMLIGRLSSPLDCSKSGRLHHAIERASGVGGGGAVGSDGDGCGQVEQ